MAKKKSKAKAKAVEQEVETEAEVADAEPTPAPAIKEEETFKVMDGGVATYYTESEYRKKYGKKK